MHLGTIQRHNKEGSTVRYLQLATITARAPTSRPRSCSSWVARTAWTWRGCGGWSARSAASWDGAGASPPAGTDQTLAVESSRQLGSVWLLEGLWRRLGVADALGQVLGGRRFTTDIERCYSPWSPTARSTR
jgi:hypothetical protein